ncbi:hypothetical protein LEP3755_13510 [Leptolyngbya sp. NIES-3755]|nr:hypothetical protein LEP3755_13510 [Leptolyngbya sp. NIES-3755]
MKRWMSWLCAVPVVVSVSTSAMAQTPNRAYAPIPLTPGREVNDRLSDADIPTGQGNFARDYIVQLQAGDQIAIDLSSDSFDTIVMLMTTNGSTVAENDDGPDGTTNSLLFTRITRTGNYIVRVRAFGETAGGPFKLRLTRLRPVQ